jgi:hypothetical protein
VTPAGADTGTETDNPRTAQATPTEAPQRRAKRPAATGQANCTTATQPEKERREGRATGTATAPDRHEEEQTEPKDKAERIKHHLKKN